MAKCNQLTSLPFKGLNRPTVYTQARSHPTMSGATVFQGGDHLIGTCAPQFSSTSAAPDMFNVFRVLVAVDITYYF